MMPLSCSFRLDQLSREQLFPAPQNATPSGVTIVASEAYNQGDEARSTPGADRAGGRRGRRPAGTSARSAPQAAKPKLTSFGTVRAAARLLEGRRRSGSSARTGTARWTPDRRRRRCHPSPRRHPAPVQGVDFSGTNVQEAGVDEPDIVKTDGNTSSPSRTGSCARSTSPARSRACSTRSRSTGAEPRAAPARRPAARPLARRLLDRAAARDGRPHDRPVPAVQLRPRRDRRVQPGRCGSSARSRSTAPTSPRGSWAAGQDRRRRSQMPGRAPVRAARRAARRRSPPRPAQNRAVLASSRVASWLPSYRIKRAGASGRQRAPARPVPRRAPSAGVLGARHADRADGRPRQGSRARRLGRGDDRRPDRLRVAGRASTSRPSAGPTGPTRASRPRSRRRRRPTIHKFDISSPTKTVYRGSGEVPGYLLNQWSLSEYQRRAARRQHRVARVVGRGRRDASRSDDAAPAGRQARPGRAGSAASARASASTRCASPATPATSSPSGRSIRSSRSTSPTRRSRACSAS